MNFATKTLTVLSIFTLATLITCGAATLAVAQPSKVWIDDDYCNGCPNDGHTWGYDAFDRIQDGIDAVESPGTVYVAAGIYEGKVVLKPQISLLGAGIDFSVIDGMGLKAGVEDTVVAMASDSKISGFSIINGGWIGVECRSVSAIIEGNLIAHHEHIGIHLIGYGSRNSIVGNNIVTDCASYEPKLQFVGAIFGNSVYGSPQIIHNTVVGNHYTGIGFCHPGTPIIKNNIVVGNLEGIGVCDNVDPNNSHNNSWNNEVYNWRGVEKGEGAISSNPLFVDEIEGDYHLQKGSPCIDAGTSENTSDTDFEGDSRPQGYGIEMGADEIVVPLGYTPVAPCRIVDTRKAGGIIFESTERDFHVYGSSDTISAQGGNPTGCGAPMGEPLSAHINMIAVNPTGKGNLQAFPVGAGTGAGLSVNYNTIDTNLANAGTVKAVTGTGPDITVASNFSSAHTVIDVLGYYYQEAGLLYAPVMPCRIVDTRYTSAGIIDADTERNFRVFGSGGAIFAQGGNPDGCPSPLGEPLAAHINMVAVYPYGKGNLQAFPLGAENGAGLSVNYNILDTNLANAGIVKTNEGAGADITVASSFSSANTVIDVLGYYYPDGDLVYTPVTPCRIVDTRKTSAGIIDANTERNFRVFGSSGDISAQGGDSAGCSSPQGEPLAAHINMVAVNPTGKGNLQAFPVGAGKGAGLSVNYNTIDTNLANAGTVKAVNGSGQDITVASNFSSAHTVIDVLGYYYEEPNLEKGLVAFYPFNGNADDGSGNGYDGIIHGDTALCEDRLGNSDSAYCFDGNGDYIEIGQKPDFPSWDTYALSVWFLNDGGGDKTNSYGQKIIDKTVYWHDFYLRVYTYADGDEPWPGSISLITYEEGGSGISDTTYDYRDNLWHHAIINKSGSYGELWVDGNLIGTDDTIKTVFSSADLLIGYCLSTDPLQRRYWSGKIDDIRIYNRALSEAEIKALYTLDE